MNSNDEWIKIYNVILDEEHFYSNQYNKNIATYLAFISALIAALLFGLINSSEWYHFLILIIPSLLILLLAWIFQNAMTRPYKRVLETITMRAKIEQELGLTQPRKPNSNVYWANEPIVYIGHLESRKDCSTSQEFIEKFVNKGHQYWYRRFFSIIYVVCIILITAFSGLAYLNL